MICHYRGHAHFVGKNSPESRKKKNWTESQIRQMMGSSVTQPIVTEQVHVACEDTTVRVEHNLVRNVATSEQGRVLRIDHAHASQYMAVTIPVLLDGRLVFLGRYRYAIGRWSIEFPRSLYQTADAGWMHPAEDNLLLDTGMQAQRMSLLGAIQIDPATISINTIVILAEGCLGPPSKSPDAASLIAGAVALSPEELDLLVLRGEISCGITLAALYLYAAYARR
jgi:hypothetical protein